ncbi:LLM class flavin-dependent oxidoreductase [Sanguibacter sp. Z1732]|uniref:LLM class flavin-dependent oxidoreductase n=1 Tax=Sanguibacter sp. Z1732 TaxID=3435412 RepID=UPI003D9CADC2
MPNYGHAVQFGVLIDAESTAQEAADLAVRAEQAGLDLAAFAAREMSGGAAGAGSDDVAAASWMDDDDDASAVAAPGEGTAARMMIDDDGASAAAGPDPWTLATWAAARTERIALAVTGLSPGYRPPSVLARAAGSLSLLSGDRAAMALAGAVASAGTSADAARVQVVPTDAEPAGVTPTEAATTEAGDTPLTEAMGVLRAMADTSTDAATYPGRHHSVTGAQPGPSLDRESRCG